MAKQLTSGPGGRRMQSGAPNLPVIAFCGWSGSGKTTLIEALIPRLTARGLAVAVVKHDAHGVRIDTPGKDSDRFFRAGADVALRGPNEAAWRLRLTSATSLERTLRTLARCHDVVLVEGHKDTPVPKVWLASSGEESPPPNVSCIAGVLPWEGRRVERAEKLVLTRLTAARDAMPVIGGILVGGASRRMGRPKQLIEVAGVSMVERVVSAIEPHADEVVLLGAGEVPRALAGLRRLVDAPGVDGPLAGILAAVRWAPHAAWIVAACDLPRIDDGAVRWILSQRRPGRWAVLPMLEVGVEPLLALYEPQAGELLEDLAADGEAAPRLLAERAEVGTPTPPDGLVCCWSNANTLRDLSAFAAG